MSSAFQKCIDHVSTCKLPLQSCSTCLFASETTSGRRHWLTAFSHGFGCSVCTAAGVDTVWGKGTVKSPIALKKQTLDRHQQSKLHTSAAHEGDIIMGRRVPSASLFEKVWQAMQSGTFSCKALANICEMSRCKVLKIKQCLGQASQEETFEFLSSEDLVLSLHNDASKSWLCVRYTGCNRNLERRSGLMGFVDLRKWKDAWAENVKDATMCAIKKACCPPGTLEHDEQLFKKVLESIEVYNADAAKDEQLAGSLLRGQKLGDMVYAPALLPSIKIIHKDKTHAARRLTSRGWAADVFLNQAGV